MTLQIILPQIGVKMSRVKDATYIRSFLIAASTPAQISFSDLRLTAEGMPPKESWPTDLAWGVHGTSAMQEGSQAMSRVAGEKNLNAFDVDVWIRIDDVHEVAATIDEAGARKTGLLVVPRLKSEFKKKIFQELLGYIEESLERVPASKKADARARLQFMRNEWDLPKLLLQYPKLVWDFMGRNPWAQCFVHHASIVIPAVQPYSQLLQIGTFRTTDAKRILAAGVRQNLAIKISF